MFPENEKDRLEDLHNTIMLIKDVIEFQQQVHYDTAAAANIPGLVL